MKFTFEKKTNLIDSAIYWVIIAVSTYTEDGIHEASVYDINWDNEEVIFSVDQPCKYIYCPFEYMNDYVFETKEEAEIKKPTLDFNEGCFAYN